MPELPMQTESAPQGAVNVDTSFEKSNNLAESKELADSFLKEADTYYTRYESDRKVDMEDVWKIADYMYKCGKNRTLAAEEIDVGANTPDDNERAQTGSTLFYRQVNQLASQGVSVMMSRDVPLKYVPISTEDVSGSSEDSRMIANQLNTLIKWTIKKDRFNLKAINFWHQIYKYGNIPVSIQMIRKLETRTVRDNIYASIPNPDGSSGVPVLTGHNYREEEFVTENYPSISLIPIENLYADMNIGNIQDQNCVIVESLKNKSQIFSEIRTGNYRDLTKELTDKFLWDGVAGSQVRKDRKDNLNQTTTDETMSGQYLIRDIFMRCPINGSSWDAEGSEPLLYFGTVIGNDMKSGLLAGLERNKDPNDRIPIEMIHCLPDDDNNLYHISPAEIVRSNYSVECTIKNQMIDNGTLVLSPPLVVLEGGHDVTDFTFKRNAVWQVRQPNAITSLEVRDITQSMPQFLEYIKADNNQALGTDKPFMGESFGARTSALESSNIYRNSIQPHLIRVRFILDQLLGFCGMNWKDYWQNFSVPGQVVAITDQEEQTTIYPERLHGEFDIEVDIVDEFEDDVVTQNRINEAMKLIAMSPEFAKRCNITELLRQWFVKNKFDASRLVNEPQDADAVSVANNENLMMMSNGVPAMVKPGENMQVHLSIHEGEKLRYRGIESHYPNYQLLEQHIEETKMAIQQAIQGVQNQPTGNQSQGAGEMGGNEIAAAQGNMAPQGA